MTRYRTAILTLAAFAASVGVTAEGAEQATEEQLLRIVQSDQASDHDKAVACEKLAIVGSAKSVLPLQPLLGTAKFSHYARYALQNIPDEEAGKSLRSALDELEGELLVGAINSVAARRDDQAIDKLVELSVSADETVSAAALAALARIDTSRAISVLTTADIESRLEFADALLFCADRLARRDQNAAAIDLLRSLDTESAPAEIRAAALLSRVRYSAADKAVSIAKALLASPDEWRFNVGLQAVVEGEISDGAQLLENTIDPADPARHARILSVLRAMEARSAVNAARIAAQSEVAAVRIEGVRTLGSLGGASDARLLLDIAAEKSPIGDAARHSLAEMENDEVNTTIVAMLRSGTGAKSALAAELIGQRRIIEGAGAIVEAAKVSEDEQTRIAALEAASRLAVGDTLPALIELATDAKSDKECHLAKQAALAAASRVPDRDEAATQICDHLESATGEQVGFLLDALAVIGGSRALDAIATMAEMQNRDTQNEATRVLGNWPSADAAPLLLRLAGSDNPFAVRALRGYLRIARQFPVSESDRLTMCRNALQIADRNDVRLLTLEVLERIPSVEALELATAELDTDRLGAKASESVMSIAQAVAPSSPDAAAVAAEHVLGAGGSPETLAAAARLLAK